MGTVKVLVAALWLPGHSHSVEQFGLGACHDPSTQPNQRLTGWFGLGRTLKIISDLLAMGRCTFH